MDSLQPVEVIAVFAPDGKITPLRFRWRGSLYPVESTGGAGRLTMAVTSWCWQVAGRCLSCCFPPRIIAGTWSLGQIPGRSESDCACICTHPDRRW